MNEEEQPNNGITTPTEAEAYEVNHLSGPPSRLQRFVRWLASPRGKVATATSIATAAALSAPIEIHAQSSETKPVSPGLFDPKPYEQVNPPESEKILPPLVFDLNSPDTLIKMGTPIELNPNKHIEVVLTEALRQGIDPGFETIPVGEKPIKTMIQSMSLSEYNAYRYGEGNSKRLAKLTPEELKREQFTMVIKEDPNMPWIDGAQFQIRVIDPKDPENKKSPAIILPTIEVSRFIKKF